MLQIKIVDSLSTQINKEILIEIFKLRYQAFVERLNWEVNSNDGLEKDKFDDLNVSHITMIDSNSNVVGCWRALPTQGDYMLKDIFPQLLQGEAAPQCEDVWEISRFTVKNISKNYQAGLVGDATFEMIRSFYYFALENNIKNYVLVTTVACERILRLLGVRTRRMGAGRVIKVGAERSVALWIDVENSFEKLAA